MRTVVFVTSLIISSFAFAIGGADFGISTHPSIADQSVSLELTVGFKGKPKTRLVLVPQPTPRGILKTAFVEILVDGAKVEKVFVVFDSQGEWGDNYNTAAFTFQKQVETQLSDKNVVILGRARKITLANGHFHMVIQAKDIAFDVADPAPEASSFLQRK